ncbi:Fucolectin-5 [Merluccius polli]|uniref:Fucolectin-5 n=1 Tax=Merluccius polli TaxID=89951 RepID=A0AA47M5S7_MERPO|nr:Fucolectin-5 [Merluccius polli]
MTESCGKKTRIGYHNFDVIKSIVIHLWNTPGLSASSDINVASYGCATQSSTAENYEPSRAIDENINSYSLTNGGSQQWWRVQLAHVYKVAEIKVNEISTLDGVEILIGNSPENNSNVNPRCVIISNKNSDQVNATFQCRGMEGRFINFYKPCGTSKLKLHEVEVFGECMPPPPLRLKEVTGRTFILVKKKLCWSDALLYCRDFHSDLLSIRDTAEQEKMNGLIKGFPNVTSQLWVGLRRSTLGSSWFWMTGDPMTFTQWEHGPMSSYPPSPCGSVASMNASAWSRRYCDEHLYFICLTDPAENMKKVRFFSSTRVQTICGTL